MILLREQEREELQMEYLRLRTELLGHHSTHQQALLVGTGTEASLLADCQLLSCPQACRAYLTQCRSFVRRAGSAAWL